MNKIHASRYKCSKNFKRKIKVTQLIIFMFVCFPVKTMKSLARNMGCSPEKLMLDKIN